MQTNFAIDVSLVSGVSRCEVYLLASKTARIKPLNLEKLINLTENERAERLTQYSKAHRLVYILETSNLMRELHISPDSPFVNDLQRNRDLTVGDRKIDQVSVLTKEDYASFTGQVLETLSMEATDSMPKKENAVDESKPFTSQIAAAPSRLAVKSFHKIATNTAQMVIQAYWHEIIMDILKIIDESQKRNAELNKEKLAEKRGARKELEKAYERADIIAGEIKVSQIEKDYLHRQLQSV